MTISRSYFDHCLLVSANVFANNRLSIQLLSNNPLTDIGLFWFVQSLKILKWKTLMLISKFYSTDLCFKSATLLSEVLADSEWGFSYEPCHAAFNRYTGFPGTLFEYFQVCSVWIF